MGEPVEKVVAQVAAQDREGLRGMKCATRLCDQPIAMLKFSEIQLGRKHLCIYAIRTWYAWNQMCSGPGFMMQNRSYMYL